MFDQDTLYIAARCWDTAPPERWVANELRRDTNQLRQNDTFGVILDTFYDRRNGFLFYTNPLGARADQAVTDEGNLNPDWNPVWDVRTGRFPGGWTVEMAIPFKSLRYRSGVDQVWGINIRRVIRRKNEWTHLTPMPAAAGVPGGMFRLSGRAPWSGSICRPASKNVELKPYGISRLTTDRLQKPAVQQRPGWRRRNRCEIRGDGEPHRRPHRQHRLRAGGGGRAAGESDAFQPPLSGEAGLLPGGTRHLRLRRGVGRANSNQTLTPSLFYSRRIGLNGGRVIPIDVGGRLTGKVGSYGIGAMNIETRDDAVSRTPRTNFSVLRLKRDILRRSTIGAIVTNRSQSTVTPGASNLAYGADAAFSFFQDLNLGAYWARSVTDGFLRDNDSYQGRFDYAGDRYGAQAQYLKVGDNFNPEVGFVRRDNFRRSFGQARFSPRPKVRFKTIRQVHVSGEFEYIENGAGQLETRIQSGRFAVERQNSDQFSVEPHADYELLLKPFVVAPGVVIPRGSYSFNDITVAYQMGLQRRVSGTWTLQAGEFYDGTIAAVSYTAARLSLLKQWSVEPGVSINDVSLPGGEFTTTLLRARTDYGFSPRMFVSALLQYASTDNVFSSNLRFRWSTCRAASCSSSTRMSGTRSRRAIPG